jgi:hypothetical protein
VADRTREEMVHIINSGASVMLNNGSEARIVARIQDLPTVADFAKKSGDPVKVQSAREDLLARKKAIEDELALIGPMPELAEVLRAS